MIKQIYFDFGGVLVKYHRTFDRVCRNFSLDFPEFKQFFLENDDELCVGTMQTADFWQKCIDKYNLENAQNYDLAQQWVLDYDIIKPIQDLIYSLESKIDVGIISNVASDVWQSALENKMVPNINYCHVYLSCQLKTAKPHKKIYEIVQQQSDLQPHEILFIDDRADYLAVPQQMGWNTVLFDNTKPDEGIKTIYQILGDFFKESDNQSCNQ